MVNTKPYWKKLKQTLLSPEFHWTFLKARLKANFLNSPLYRRLMAVGFTVTVAILVSANHSWSAFLVAWVLPLCLYQSAALLQFLSEHNWAGIETNESKSHGRFCGEAPPFGQSTFAWLGRLLRTIYHLWVRIAILPGEMPEHDWHHHSPKDQTDWANGTYARQRQVETGKEYMEFWGLENAIDRVFQGFAQAPGYGEDLGSNASGEITHN